MSDQPPNHDTQPGDFAVRVQGLSVVRRDTKILDNVSCTLERGRYTAILGPNGCGKTTFSRCLLGQMFASAGTVTVLGQTLGQTDIRKLRKRIGVVNPTTDSGGHHITGAVVDADLSATEAVITGYFATVGLYDRYTDAQRDRPGIAHPRRPVPPSGPPAGPFIHRRARCRPDRAVTRTRARTINTRRADRRAGPRGP
ncbi:MAG: ATP-binding cassette domain-containing protein [Phycisphaerales bacterium]